MKFGVKKWRGASVVSVTQKDSMHKGLDKLDLQFSVNRERHHEGNLQGCGLYAIFFRRRLIYVGKFLGTKKDYWLGNVADARWWKHCATLSMRGRNVGSTRLPLAQAIAKRTRCELLRGLSRSTTYLRKTGCQASENRLIFASRYWRESFQNASCDNILSDMTFMYVRILPDERMGSVQCVREGISQAENDACRLLQPVVNKGMPWRDIDRRQHGKEVKRVLKKTLSNYRFLLHCQIDNYPLTREDYLDWRSTFHQPKGSRPRTPIVGRVAVKPQSSPRSSPPSPSAVNAVQISQQLSIASSIRMSLGARATRYVVRDERRGTITIGSAGRPAHVQVNVGTKLLSYTVKPIGASGALALQPRIAFVQADVPALVAAWCP